MYKKGVNGCEKYFFQKPDDNVAAELLVSDNLVAKHGMEGEVKQANRDEFMKEKLAAYKDFYNQLPRGFFK